MKKALFYLLTMWLFLWAQGVSNHFLGGTLFSVQWILLAVLHFGLTRGPWAGESVGFIWGMFIDASTLGLLGVHASLYALAGFASGMLRRQLDSSKRSTQAIFSWMVSVVYFALYLIIERFFSIGEGPFQWGLVTMPLMNAVFAPLVFQALDVWAKAWDLATLEI